MNPEAIRAELKPRRLKREIYCRPLSFLEDNQKYIIFDAQSGKLMELNAMARQIYHLCDGSRTVREIGEELTPNCDDEFLNQVVNIIHIFEQNSMVEVSSLN